MTLGRFHGQTVRMGRLVLAVWTAVATGVVLAPVGSGAADAPQTVSVPRPGGKHLWIDAHEVTVKQFRACVAAGACTRDHFLSPHDPPCNYGAEHRNDYPMNCVDWDGADAYCRWSGGRLCKPEEWFDACRGPKNQDYPYAATFDLAACNAALHEPNTPFGDTEPAGKRATCDGGYKGLRDMVGNVTEWVDECKDTYCLFYGGAYTENPPLEDFASCKQVCAGNDKTFKSSTIGFRCCRDKRPAK